MEEKITLLENVMDNTEINATALAQVCDDDYEKEIDLWAAIGSLNSAVMCMECAIDQLRKEQKANGTGRDKTTPVCGEETNA